MIDLRLGCGLAGLRALDAGSVDLVLSDLPSGETRAPFDQAPDLDDLNAAVWHALKPSGVAVFMSSTFDFAHDLRRTVQGFAYERIWRKNNPTGFLNVAHRPLKAHEYILVFRGKGATYTPQMSTGHKPMNSTGPNGRSGGHGANYGVAMRDQGASRAGATDRHPTSVLSPPGVGRTSPERRHPQQKPPQLLREFVLTHSNAGDLVVDPFAGSGSTGRVAWGLGRRFVGWELSEENHAKALDDRGQPSLFGRDNVIRLEERG